MLQVSQLIVTIPPEAAAFPAASLFERHEVLQIGETQ
jgi:hypothetical protein